MGNSVQRMHPLIQRAWELFYQGKFDEAARGCEENLAQGGDDACLLLAMCRLEQGRTEEAEDVLDDIRDEMSLKVPLAILRGQCALQAHRFDEARVHFVTALDFHPDNIGAKLGLAKSFIGQGERSEGRRLLEEIIAVDEKNVPSLFEIGVLSLEESMADAAIVAFRSLSKLLPKNAQVVNNLGLAYQLQKTFDKAENQYRQAVNIDSEYAEAWFNLSAVLSAQNKSEQAAEALDKALKLKPELKLHVKE
jgi:tetratricopeptide (TPR) repeat protein